MKSKSLLLFIAYTLLMGSGASAQTWSALGGPAFSQGSVYYTSMAIGLNDTPYIAYLDQANNDAVSVKKFNGTSWVYVGSPGFSNTVATTQGNEISLVLKISAAGQPYVFYQDSVAPPFSVMTYTGGSWIFVDTPGIGMIITANFPQPDALTMDLDASGNPYIGFINDNHGSQASVFKHTAGSGWASVGPTNFTPSGADDIFLALDHTGSPWLAFNDANSNHLSVQKFNGTNWILQGNAGFSIGYIGAPASLAFDNNNNPYAAYGDGDNAYNANVMTLSGGSWVSVGGVDFTAGAANYINLSMAFGDIPVIAYNDGNAANKNATVEYYDGLGWISLGNADFSGSEADWVSMAIAPNGIPYVSFEDDANGHAASVYSFGAGVPSGINAISSVSELNIYPNPNNGKFQIAIKTNVQEDVQLSLYDMLGQQIWLGSPVSVSGGYIGSVDIAGLPAGLYTLQVKTQDGVESRKIEIK